MARKTERIADYKQCGFNDWDDRHLLDMARNHFERTKSKDALNALKELRKPVRERTKTEIEEKRKKLEAMRGTVSKRDENGKVVKDENGKTIKVPSNKPLYTKERIERELKKYKEKGVSVPIGERRAKKLEFCKLYSGIEFDFDDGLTKAERERKKVDTELDELLALADK